MDNIEDLTRKLDELTGTMREVVRAQNEARKADDGARKAEALDATAEVSRQLTELSNARHEASVDRDIKSRNDEINVIVQEAVKAALRGTRAPSMAEIIGSGSTPEVQMRAMSEITGHPAMKAALGPDYQAGSLLTAIMDVRGVGGLDIEAHQKAKAALARMGLDHVGSPGKATLGTTGATGGYEMCPVAA